MIKWNDVTIESCFNACLLEAECVEPGCFGGSETEGSDQQQMHYDSFILNLPEMTPQALQANHQDLSEDVRDNRSQISPLLLEIPAMVCLT